MKQEKLGKGCCGCVAIVFILLFVIGFISSMFDQDNETEEVSSDASDDATSNEPEEPYNQRDETVRVVVQKSFELRTSSRNHSRYGCLTYPDTEECIFIEAGSIVEIEEFGGTESKISWDHSDGNTYNGSAWNKYLSLPATVGDEFATIDESTRFYSIPDGNQHHHVENSSGDRVSHIPSGTIVKIDSWDYYTNDSTSHGTENRVKVSWEYKETEDSETVVLEGWVNMERLAERSEEDNLPFAVEITNDN